MRLILDGKSVAVGVFVGAALVSGFGAMQPDGRSGIRGFPGQSGLPGTPERSADVADRPASQVGRFQIAAAGTQDQISAYVVDTATGKVWWSRQDGGAFLDPKTGPAE